jgi:hypothetical protein
MRKYILSFIIAIGFGIISISAQSTTGTSKTETNNHIKQKPVKRMATPSVNKIEPHKTGGNPEKPANTPPRNGGSFGRKEIEAKPTPEPTPIPK